jgi:hypothetical protein
MTICMHQSRGRQIYKIGVYSRNNTKISIKTKITVYTLFINIVVSYSLTRQLFLNTHIKYTTAQKE